MPTPKAKSTKASKTIKTPATIAAAEKKLEAAIQYRDNASDQMVDAESPDGVNEAYSSYLAGKNRVRKAKEELRQAKKDETNGEPSTLRKVVGMTALIGTCIIAGAAGAVVYDKLGEESDEADTV
jgi:hypothetical protein